MSGTELTVSILLNIAAGLLVAAMLWAGGKLLRDRRRKAFDRNMTDRHDLAQLATYLTDRPHLISIIRSNYRARLAQDAAFTALQVLLTFLVWRLLARYAFPGTDEIVDAAIVVLFALVLFGGLKARRVLNAATRQRALAKLLDQHEPYSSDLTDDRWRYLS